MDFDNALLVTQEEINNEARPCKAQQELADRCIEEAQMLDIKPNVGDDIYMRLFDTSDDVAQQLWHGCTYTDDCGKTRIFAGVRKALLYYAYGRIVRASGGVVTRFDYVTKRGEYSNSASDKTKQSAYSEAFAIADGYMAQALDFIATMKMDCGHKRLKNNRIKIKMIGR